MSNEPTIKEQYQALMDVVPSQTVLVFGALVIALGKACIAFATGDPTFDQVFGLVGGFAWFIAIASGAAVSAHSGQIKAREKELVRGRLRNAYGARH
ncbi:hypothetical protein [Marinobacter sp.]|uniref:hypothetical protein n=1 Tax=Marinobacter sp. TaxID=50741 RepID=UPI0026210005|nr:hypothetical protein [Marinobacter sp.]